MIFSEGNLNSFSKDHTISPEVDIHSIFDKFYPNKDSLPYYLENNEISNDLELAKKALSKFKNKTQLVHIGIGGSSLGPECLVKCLKEENREKVIFLDNSDPEYIEAQLKLIELENAIFYIVSKSGSTIEPLSIMSILNHELKNAGLSFSSDNTLVCTDPNQSELLNWARQNKIETMRIPPSIGGRFSLLTHVGMIPALFYGINFKEVINGAKSFLKNTESIKRTFSLATDISENYKKGINETVLFIYSNRLKILGDWFQQLWGESLGKKTNQDFYGLTPIISLGAKDQHSMLQLFSDGTRNKLFLFLENIKPSVDFTHEVDGFEELSSMERLNNIKQSVLFSSQLKGVQRDLTEQNLPTGKLQVTGICESEIGQLLTFFMILTTQVANQWKINPFDQPGVERSKRFSKEILNSSN